MTFNPIPLHQAKIGDYVLMADGSGWIINNEESLNQLPSIAFYNDSMGLNLPVVFEHLWEVMFYTRRN